MRRNERGRWRESVADVARLGLLAEYDDARDLVRAAAAMRERGYERLDTFTPYEIPGLEHILGIRRTRVPLITLLAAITGATVGYLVQWWTNAVAYPIQVGGRPLHSAPAYVPITFETTVLFGGIATFLAVLALSRLTRLWAPVDEIEGFERATVDRYWLAVDWRDPRFDPERTATELEATAPLRVVRPPSRARLAVVRGAPIAPILIAFVFPPLAALLGGCDVAGPEPNFSLERMINQPRDDPWESSTVFPDGKVMRDPPPGAIERGRELGPPGLIEGGEDGAWARDVAIEPDAALLARGRERFDIYCAPCHGVDGAAATYVAKSMSLRPPPSLVEGEEGALEPGRVFHAATEGWGLMPSYQHQLSIRDRWAVTAWIEVLRLRAEVPLDSLDPQLRERAQRELAAAPPASAEERAVPEPRGMAPREPGLPAATPTAQPEERP
jgi:mono/diheme cytochrome c family protein